MTAEEARKLSFDSNRDNSGYNRIVKAIQDEARKGEYLLFWADTIDEYARQQLNIDGFNVGNTTYDRNEPFTKISWSAI